MSHLSTSKAGCELTTDRPQFLPKPSEPRLSLEAKRSVFFSFYSLLFSVLPTRSGLLWEVNEVLDIGVYGGESYRLLVLEFPPSKGAERVM